jgi:methylglutaconyl-CoA hydratase
LTPLAEHAVEGGVGRLRLCRAAKRNALDHPTADAAIAGIKALTAAGVAAAVFEADGPVFCSGEDRVNTEPPFASERLLAALRESDLVWLARVEGPAIGVGVALVAACDLAVASPSAWFRLPEIEHDAFPAATFAALVPTIGRRAALELCLSGRTVDAAAALRLGLLGTLVAEDEIEGEVQRRLKLLAAHPGVVREAARSDVHI